MVLQTPRDVARELRRNPGQEYELRPARGPLLRVYARHSGTITIWKPNWPRPLTGLVNLTEVELGQGPYLVQRVHDTA
ncbi:MULTISPECIES: hypothetical protein [Meiothermus]|uniref:Uncharacterized protein n=2 Tax=Meiothermus taiwanensis TaxID=172827 RepID=A0A399E557_9DEIN|nr:MULTISPECIES: hypothetical protein [Meiothermus]AWR86801.1 hypothetical protein Mtai_v1c15600 [Meiothermus taiwanensis WR-220]MCL6528886.1 hypothetical protein [Meiothermus ruber]RIH79026.1 hypothetical protein Mcate_00539 [Meiothermus taiwanensis]